MNQPIPKWLTPYATGKKQGWAQSYTAYAEYYCVDGAADDLSEEGLEERLIMMRPPLVAYASRTGTRRNLEALRRAGWHLLVSAKGTLRTEGMPYALDNGAWTAYQQGQPFDEDAFLRALDAVGEDAEWIVLPDIVEGGVASLDYSLKWMERLRGIPTTVLIAVQDGMQIEDVRSLLSPVVGIFVGGSTAWKEATARAWGSLARQRNCYLHVGRVNSVRRIRICAAAGANSIDGTSVSRFAVTLPPLDAAARQEDMFSTAHDTLADAQQATRELDLSALVGGRGEPLVQQAII
ncbi:hypothetical protein SB768_25160 [Burkholderia sp. SIMBA_043]|uniref:hypothetical protein n=1 Tax=Burkholderia TaxID=32008 RepID=UPI0005D7FECE|nr:hypothetical protein [Burkholderia vietnamiensis]AJY03002.1 hypothetical protein AK36_6103 [Burkholderia vietnamiensis LMG 10929]AVR13972.1 hypothetical protein A8H33_10435 [Burkholderia vietnamiensis]KVM41696.1 hypothetical protein WJ57_29890 [Burkholderia vietnamiensis]KVS03775.1 hypothetical protein WK30_10385 [Burkholderia vietnamiensis]UBI29151.1 hypothetical protein LA325_31195 [Burkholderia vietnamiensis]